MSKFQGNNILTRCLMIKNYNVIFEVNFTFSQVWYRHTSLFFYNKRSVFHIQKPWNDFPNIFQEKTNGNTSNTKGINEKRHWSEGWLRKGVVNKSLPILLNWKGIKWTFCLTPFSWYHLLTYFRISAEHRFQMDLKVNHAKGPWQADVSGVILKWIWGSHSRGTASHV